jgi:putative flavoprotein involved in K+ transport
MPPLAQQFEQSRRQHHGAIPLSLALLDPERHALTVNVGDLQVIGAGQAGLAIGYQLKQAKRDFVILDAAPAIGETWRTRYDSMRLFTPTALNDLPGLPFPRSGRKFPSKDEMADYLIAYAKRWELPVELETRVIRLRTTSGGYEVETTGDSFLAPQVVVATGAFQIPRVPSFSMALAVAIAIPTNCPLARTCWW